MVNVMDGGVAIDDAEDSVPSASNNKPTVVALLFGGRCRSCFGDAENASVRPPAATSFKVQTLKHVVTLKTQ
jgi:hypothetical protein